MTSMNSYSTDCNCFWIWH